jgi:UDP-N-acetylmuramoyl-tripeptide--D-alanyl-D-alanine ligase
MYTLSKIANWLGQTCDKDCPISFFSIDSREVEKGGIFFALKGEKVDGHNFLEEVARKGVSAAVVSKKYVGLNFGLRLFYVDDVIQALQEIARRALLERKTKVIGITGSLAKTTTKEFLYHVLQSKFFIKKSEGNRNTQSTLPLAILNAEGNEEYLILEMSMTKKGHITNLVQMAPPEIVVLTPITICHATHFQDVEGIASAKAEILAPSAKFAVIHETSISYKAVRKALTCDFAVYPKKINFEIPFQESHLRENVAGVIEVAKYLGLRDDEIIASLRGLKAFEHRFEKIVHRGITFIDDAYNANGLSMIAALKNLPNPKPGKKKIAVLGSMADLGKYSDAVHRDVANVAASYVDLLYCIGDHAKPMVEVFEKMKKEVLFFSSYEELKSRLRVVAEEGDVVLVKGSNFHKLWKVIE